MIEYEFTLDGTIPSKKNNKQFYVHPVTKKRFITSSDKYKSWHRTAMYIMQVQAGKVESKPILKALNVTIYFYMGDNRRCDSHNKAESIMDLLVDCGILKDDCWQVIGPSTYIPSMRKGKPGCKIIIRVNNG